jgi:argininosuccinate lyase
MRVRSENMYRAAGEGFINATDLADYLTKKGMPFRSAYKIVGQLVAECIEKKCVLDELSLDEYKLHTELFEDDLYEEISLKTCVEKRISEGGTSVKSVEAQIDYARKEIKK